ncbi:MAG: type II secretion system GspH family protein [Roseburia sp.]|nr:type II secretion system GspH family protein [Roseburia sp.]MCM1278060.1 type II secretion system GspH family protein [Robinsoniella sp.]
MKMQRNDKGFTLVELLIAVSILAIAVVPMLANFVTSSKVNSKAKVTMNGTIVAQNIMEGISAYGVENTIIQLEHVWDAGWDSAHPTETPTNTDPENGLKFMPSSMAVENWGRCVIECEPGTHTNTLGETVKIPKYVDADDDKYQDDYSNLSIDHGRLLAISGYEEGVYDCSYNTGGNNLESRNPRSSYSMKYAYKAKWGDTEEVYFGKPYLKDDKLNEDDDLHAYAFWLRNVQYGSKKYDVILSMDANYYRDYVDTGLVDTTEVLPNYNDDGSQIRSESAGGAYSGKRAYNDTMLSRINTNIGTNAAVDDTTSDRYFSEDSGDLGEAVTQYLLRCKGGVTSEQILKDLKREMYINIRQEANPVNPSNPYRIITVQYKYELMNASLLNSGASAVFEEMETEVFRSAANRPRNFYFYYFPNYDASSGTAAGRGDVIHIVNTAGNVDTNTSAILGTEMNFFLIRQVGNSVVDLASKEANYKMTLQLDENLKENRLENVHTHIYSNIGYNLETDARFDGDYLYPNSKVSCYVNGALVSEGDVKQRLRFGALDGINTITGSNDEDYIYEVTVQVFKAGENFNKDARIAKFTGGSN